jgi:hypothetical protein
MYGTLQDNIFAFYDIPNLAMPRSEHYRKTQYKNWIFGSSKYINFRYFQKGWRLSSPSCVNELKKNKSSMSDK